jgi:hypothetical protein
MPPRKEARANASLFAMHHALYRKRSSPRKIGLIQPIQRLDENPLTVEQR